jgi:hypothetical protein
MSPTRPPSLSAFFTWLKNPSTFPCSTNGSSSRRILSSFLTRLRVRLCSRLLRVRAYRSSSFLLVCSLSSPSETGVESEVERVLTLGANASIACSSALFCWGTCECYEQYIPGGGAYLAIFQDKAETCHDTSERVGGVCGFFRPTVK